MSVDILIVSWNGRDDTLAALDAVAPNLDGIRDSGVIVIDNGSTDGTFEEVRRRHPRTTVVRLNANRGFTGGVAAGASASQADYLVLLNNDARPQPGWLDALVTAIDAAPDDVVAASGRIVDMTGNNVDFAGGIMTFDGHAFQPGFGRPRSSVEEPEPGSEMFFACGGNMIVRRRAFDDLGGFDPDYFAYLEDVDFGWRAWLSGRRIIWAPEAEARHRSAATSDRLGNFERGVLFERNALQTVIKNYEDEALRDATGTIFLALLHRLQRYVIDRNGDTSLLTAPPIGEAGWAPPSPRGRIARILDRFRRRGVVIDDPLTMMQFRAIEWFFRNLDGIMEKRRTVQTSRRRSDREIFERFPLHIVPTYHGDERLFASELFEILKPSLTTRSKSLAEILGR